MIQADRVLGVILAAGKASRFGSPKPLAILDGQSLLARAIATLQDTLHRQPLVVLGHEWQRVAADLSDKSYFVLNEAYADGMASSIAAAARAASGRADALLVTLCDQPLISSEHLNAMLQAHSGAADDIVATGYGDAIGPPVLFGRASFAKLQALDGENGAKSVLQDPGFSLQVIHNAAAAVDIDTQADLSALQETAASRQ